MVFVEIRAAAIPWLIPAKWAYLKAPIIASFPKNSKEPPEIAKTKANGLKVTVFI